MTRIIDRIDPCPVCLQVHGRIRYQAHPQFPAHPRNNDGSPLVEIVLGVVILATFVVGLMAWSWIGSAVAR